MTNQRLLLCLGLSLLLLSVSCSRDRTESSSSSEQPRLFTIAIHTAAGKPIDVRVEVSATELQRNMGLMFRRELPPNQGMLFVFEKEEQHSFWMDNCYIPLDMIFIGATNRIVGIVHSAVPLDTTSRTVGKPSKYVLEVNGGFSKRHHIEVGDRVEFVDL